MSHTTIAYMFVALIWLASLVMYVVKMRHSAKPPRVLNGIFSVTTASFYVVQSHAGRPDGLLTDVAFMIIWYCILMGLRVLKPIVGHVSGALSFLLMLTVSFLNVVPSGGLIAGVPLAVAAGSLAYLFTLGDRYVSNRQMPR